MQAIKTFSGDRKKRKQGFQLIIVKYIVVMFVSSKNESIGYTDEESMESIRVFIETQIGIVPLKVSL